jgi:hypothetical protein
MLKIENTFASNNISYIIKIGSGDRMIMERGRGDTLPILSNITSPFSTPLL